jgi:hypothetical protein
MKLKKILHAAAMAGLCSVSVSAANLTYSLSGGQITGTLGGAPFTNANWTITATADSSTAQFLAQGSNGGTIWAPVYYQAVTPTITITFGSSVLTATLTVTGAGQWFLESRDYSIYGTPNQGGIGFFYAVNGIVEGGNGAYIGGIIGFNNLQTLGTINGTSGFDTGSGGMPFPTSAGNLVITTGGAAAGTFVTAGAASPASVPEESSVASLGLALAGLYQLRRRLQKQATV